MRELAELTARQVGWIATETSRPGGAPDLLWLVEQAGLARDHLANLATWAEEEFAKEKE